MGPPHFRVIHRSSPTRPASRPFRRGGPCREIGRQTPRVSRVWVPSRTLTNKTRRTPGEAPSLGAQELGVLQEISIWILFHFDFELRRAVACLHPSSKPVLRVSGSLMQPISHWG